MPKFLIKYIFEGTGEVTIEANSKEEAEYNFFNGDHWENETESGDNYCIQDINQINP